ncbi:MAG: helix-turn-helix transcriptional regulator [Anaerolineae bacterium]|nr:helix-turn-helix transcriptional regulator [Anaerolineae bacterium]
MPRPKRTEEEIEEMRERILDAAHGILTEEGPNALSIRAIAERVGVSHMVLYTYFDDRDALFAALINRQHQRKQKSHNARMARATEGQTLDVMREVLQSRIAFARDHPEMFRFIWHMPEHARRMPPHPRPHPAQGDCRPRMGIHREIDNLSELIQVGIDQGVFAPRDPNLAAIALLGLINGTMILSQFPGILKDAARAGDLEQEVVTAGMNYLTSSEAGGD